jgi:L-arabinose isomerase
MSVPDLKAMEVWLVTGSQHLYGPEILETVVEHSGKIVEGWQQSGSLPVQIRFQPVVTTPEEITAVMAQANESKACIGIIAWMHTFSPAKMWIQGLKKLQKPLLHLHTQFNRDIPWDKIDMNFMNLNQSAHGDREFGFMMSRMRLNRKVVVGYWRDEQVLSEISSWARAAAAWADWQGARFVRFGDNMRQVAVTEGDKVEAEMKFGFSVNTHGVGDLVARIKKVKTKETEELMAVYNMQYKLSAALKKNGKQYDSLREAARIEVGIRAFLQEGGYKGYTNTFEDLHGLAQLPGIATQRLMAEGYGFGAEGDWKTSALVRAMKVMAAGLPGGNSFMEDYTYHFDPRNPLVLGAHMLEICPSIARDKPSCEVHPLGIGGKADPVRLVFDVAGGAALNASLIDMGNRFRLLVNEVQAVNPQKPMPKLPVARVLWKPMPDLSTGAAAWILAGGAHHTVFSQNLSVQHLRDFADMAGIELLCIDKETQLPSFRDQLRWNELYYQLKTH